MGGRRLERFFHELGPARAYEHDEPDCSSDGSCKESESVHEEKLPPVCSRRPALTGGDYYSFRPFSSGSSGSSKAKIVPSTLMTSPGFNARLVVRWLFTRTGASLTIVYCELFGS